MQDNAGRLLPEEEIIAKYTIKDSVFSDLFKIKKISPSVIQDAPPRGYSGHRK